MDIASFVNKYLPQAQTASAQTGLPVDFILSQAALETGNGTSNAAVTGNNFFGISPGGSLASYPSVDAGFSAYSNLINSRYSGASSFVGNGPTAIGSYLNGNGYSTTPDYAQRVAALVPGVDAALSAGGNSAGVVSGSDAANGGSSCGMFDFGCKLDVVGGWVGSVLTRGVLIVLGFALIFGAIYMFATDGKGGATVVPIPV